MFLHSNYPLQSQVHVYLEELATLDLFLILENASPTNVQTGQATAHGGS